MKAYKEPLCNAIPAMKICSPHHLCNIPEIRDTSHPCWQSGSQRFEVDKRQDRMITALFICLQKHSEIILSVVQSDLPKKEKVDPNHEFDNYVCSKLQYSTVA